MMPEAQTYDLLDHLPEPSVARRAINQAEREALIRALVIVSQAQSQVDAIVRLSDALAACESRSFSPEE